MHQEALHVHSTLVPAALNIDSNEDYASPFHLLGISPTYMRSMDRGLFVLPSAYAPASFIG
jgi:hypothetical protein